MENGKHVAITKRFLNSIKPILDIVFNMTIVHCATSYQNIEQDLLLWNEAYSFVVFISTAPAMFQGGVRPPPQMSSNGCCPSSLAINSPPLLSFSSHHLIIVSRSIRFSSLRFIFILQDQFSSVCPKIFLEFSAQRLLAWYNILAVFFLLSIII